MKPILCRAAGSRIGAGIRRPTRYNRPMTETGFPRRDLFRAAGATALAATAASYSEVLGANDKVQLGVIGFGGRGTFVSGVFQKNATVKIGARGFRDHRKLLEM